jgi:L-serine/L-threonine ammonia-lyase
VPTPTSHGATLPHLIIASGGNAGIAAASAARALDVQCTVFLPSSAAGLVGVLEREGPPGAKLDVRIGGENYYEALGRAERFKAEVGASGWSPSWLFFLNGEMY